MQRKYSAGELLRITKEAIDYVKSLNLDSSSEGLFGLPQSEMDKLHNKEINERVVKLRNSEGMPPDVDSICDNKQKLAWVAERIKQAKVGNCEEQSILAQWC